MIDWHCHILPAVDDGPEDMQHALSMAAALASAGFTTVYCTPHLMRGCYDADNDRVRQGVAELQQQLNVSGIPLTLLPGREYCLDEYLLNALEDPLPLGDSRQVLVEILPRTTADMVRQLLYAVVRSGFTPVIAHPERCQLLLPDVRPARGRGFLASLAGLVAGDRRSRHQDQGGASGNQLLDYLRDLGCCFQGNLGSFTGYYGGQVRSVAEELRRLGVYDRYGSDLHAPGQAQAILGV